MTVPGVLITQAGARFDSPGNISGLKSTLQIEI